MSNRITTTIAINAASKMADKLFSKKIDEAHKNFLDYFECIYKASVDPKMLNICKDYPNWFECVQTVGMFAYEDDGKRHSNLYGNISFSTSNRFRLIEISYAEYKNVLDYYRKYTHLCDKRSVFFDETYHALRQLGTLKKVKETLPEAVPYLDFPDKKNLPAPQFTELRNILKSL